MSTFKTIKTFLGYLVAGKKPMTQEDIEQQKLNDFLMDYRRKHGRGFTYDPGDVSWITNLKSSDTSLHVEHSEVLVEPTPSTLCVLPVPKFSCLSKVEPSPAEALIIEALKCYPHVEWYREVSFERFTTPKGGYYRFDFYLPALGLIIEYNGQRWHEGTDRQEVDVIKAKFCADHGLKLLVFDKKHYYQLGAYIDDLLYSHGVQIA